jgi:hypothetical protein
VTFIETLIACSANGRLSGPRAVTGLNQTWTQPNAQQVSTSNAIPQNVLGAYAITDIIYAFATFLLSLCADCFNNARQYLVKTALLNVE